MQTQTRKLQVAKAPMAPDWPIIGWFAGLHALAIFGPIFVGVSTTAIVVTVILYFVTGMLGITLGYHRLLTHRTFKAPRWVERTLATFGVLALQRGPFDWVGHHRMHHSFTDTGKDPHDSNEGFWWSHIGWMCRKNPEITDHAKLKRFARDIAQDPYLMALSGVWPQVGLQVALGLLLWAVFDLQTMIWGVFVRAAVVYHVTWFVNSATHKWGYRNYETKDSSSNNWWVGLLAFGEGWHNNHHTHPDIAPAGHKWWEFDLTWQVIKLMRLVGLAYDVKVLPAEGSDVEPARPRPRKIAVAGGGGAAEIAMYDAKD